MNIQYIHPADQLVMFMQRIYDKGLTTMSGGNLSIRDTQGNIWITPAGIDKGTLTRKDIICVRPDGSCEGPHKPSSELPFHESVYRMRPDLNAVLHAHPPALVAFSIVRKLPDLDLIPSVRHICEQMKIATYAVPGSEALGVEIGKVFSQGCDTALLENHGVCIGAPDMFTAFQRFETLNYTATLEVLASKLGKIHSLPENAYHMSETNAHTKLDDFIPRSHTSEELAARLREMGIVVTQATVSRDIKELRLLKVLLPQGGYKYAVADKADHGLADRFVRIFRDSVLSIQYASNIVVIKTLSGSANAAAEAVDSMRWPELLGTMAGDNTILAVAHDEEAAKAVVDKFHEMLK